MTDIAWERRGNGVFFTLERGGTRNIWRAFPDPQDDSRFPVWRALPVTELRAPLYAAQPTSLPGDRALVCVSNALASAPNTTEVAQIVRYDLVNSEFRALSDGARLYQAPQVSPDGMSVAFAGGENDNMRVFAVSNNNAIKRVIPEVKLVGTQMRRPIWLDDQTLLMENLAPQARGLYQMPIDGSRPAQVVVRGGGEASILGASGLVFSAKTSRSAPTSLYVVARDGSGLRMLAETSGARRPATSPNGQMLAYDSPQGSSHALWVVPLLSVKTQSAAYKKGFRLIADETPKYEEPMARLSSVRAGEGGVAVIGMLRCATSFDIKLEVGEGGKPRRWKTLSLPFPPISTLLDARGNRVLAIWNPPPRAKGEWTLRLSLSGLGSGVQSLLRVRLPISTSRPPLPPLVPTEKNLSKDGTEQTRKVSNEPLPRSTPLPNLPDVVPMGDGFSPIPVPLPESSDDLPTFPSVQIPDNSPFMPAKVPTTAGVEIVPIDPSGFKPAPKPVAPQNVATQPVGTPPIASDQNGSDGDYDNRPDAPEGTPFVAQFDVAGTPARMAPREKRKVTFRGINRGTSDWETGSSGPNRVRVVARWVDFSTGTRRQWNFFWLRESVASGERTTWEFDVSAPARPGKYKLIYGLVRLPESGEYKAPAYSEPQENWADEFGAIAFAVEVAPN